MKSCGLRAGPGTCARLGARVLCVRLCGHPPCWGVGGGAAPTAGGARSTFFLMDRHLCKPVPRRLSASPCPGRLSLTLARSQCKFFQNDSQLSPPNATCSRAHGLPGRDTAPSASRPGSWLDHRPRAWSVLVQQLAQQTPSLRKASGSESF